MNATEFFLHGGLESGPAGWTDDEAWQVHGRADHCGLREHEAGAKTADLAPKHGISEATLYNWKSKYGGMDVNVQNINGNVYVTYAPAERPAQGLNSKAVSITERRRAIVPVVVPEPPQ